MDSSKEWPNNVLTTKEYIMSRYPPFHTIIKTFDYDLEEYEEEKKGTILHHIGYSLLSNEMIIWMIEYYKLCATVVDKKGYLPLEEALDCISDTDETTQSHIILINGLCKIYPEAVLFCDVFCLVGINVKNPDICDPILHILLDYTKEKVPHNHLMPDGREVGNIFCWLLRTILQARYKCRLVATIVEKRRVVNKNKDVSWLLSRYILATRTNEEWIKQ